MINGNSDALLPRPGDAVIVVPPPGSGAGYWAGGPSAVVTDDGSYLAYRLRRPVGSGRGYAIALAFARDGVNFENAGAGNQGRAGRRIAGAPRARAVAGRPVAAVPELRHHGHQALAGRGGAELRGADGVALGTDPAALTATSAPGAGPAASSPYHGGGLRYLELADLPDGRTRLYYEMTQPDGSHAVVTELRWRLPAGTWVPAGRRGGSSAGSPTTRVQAPARSGTKFAAFGVPRPVTGSQPVVAGYPGTPVPT